MSLHGEAHHVGGSSDERVILVVDTDSGVRWSLEKGLTNSGYRVHTASTVEAAVRVAQIEPIAGILLELSPDAGLTVAVLSSLLRAPSSPRIICTSIHSEPRTIIDCMRRGASDFLLKPFSLAEVRAAFIKSMDSTAEATLEEKGLGDAADHESSLLIGVSPPIQELRVIIKQVAQTDLNCLIRGDSGTGKDLVAREIHRLSPRSDKPYIKVNCSALPEQLLESELFGYERGAFTGAVTSKPGRFSLADHGIIFLDEICEMHPSLQAKFLQVIEHKEFVKLGGREPVKVDVQIIAATNANIEEMTKQGTFRQDLYFRLNEVCIWSPSLAQRREDIPLLVRHFLKKYKEFSGDRPLELTGEDLAELSGQEWPGNIRELESTIKRWLVLGKQGQGVSSGGEVPAHVVVERKRPTASELTPGQILEHLEGHRWNRRKAAESLGISYQALRRRIEKFKLNEQR